MSGLGYVSLSARKTRELNVNISLDESICGMLFDVSHWDDVYADNLLAETSLSNNQVILVNSLEEAVSFGIDQTLMAGIPYYHIKSYYDYIGIEAPLYILFSDCSYDGLPDFSIIEDMQRAINGKMFQIGVWTEFPVWAEGDDEYVFTGLIPAMQNAAEQISGQIGQPTDESSPLSIILFANTAKLDGGAQTDHRKIPSGLNLGCHRVSLVLGQNGSSEVHSMQDATSTGTPVGMLGFTMACLTLASAEESIAWVGEFDLNKNDTMVSPELGFGIGRTPISSLNEIRRDIIAAKGYILPTIYKAKESGVFMSGEQTLSNGDYYCIANNRVINKGRRIIKRVMFPHVNKVWEVNHQTGELTQANISILVTEIIDALDRYLINGKGQPQVNGRDVEIGDTENILVDDKVSINAKFIPANSNAIINVEEYFSLNG